MNTLRPEYPNMYKSDGRAEGTEGDYLSPAGMPAGGSYMNPSLLQKSIVGGKKVNGLRDTYSQHSEEGDYMHASNLSSNRSVATEVEEEDDYMFPGTNSASSLRDGFGESEYGFPADSSVRSTVNDIDYMFPASVSSVSSRDHGFDSGEYMHAVTGKKSTPTRPVPAPRKMLSAYEQPDGGGYKDKDAYAEVSEEVSLGEEGMLILKEINLPEYDETVPYKHLVRAPVSSMTEQATPIAPPSSPEELPPRASYTLWKDISDVLYRKESGILSSWGKKSATLTRQSLALYKDSRNNHRIQVSRRFSVKVETH